MLYLLALCLTYVHADTAMSQWLQVKWNTKKEPTETQQVTEGVAHVCTTQPSPTEVPVIGDDQCQTNADCGSALCVKMMHEEKWVKRCGCGDFERRFNHEQVTVCSCLWVDSVGTCLKIWRDSIMCKFTCKNCFNCDEKNLSDCALDKTCQVEDLTCTAKPDLDCAPQKDEANCVNDVKCRWSKIGKEEERQCVPRTYVYVNEDGQDKNCPLGTMRAVDQYQGAAGTFFDTCTAEHIPQCRYYEWDGNSCKTCAMGYRGGMVAKPLGNGRIKTNAICVVANNNSNRKCAVFFYDHKQVQEANEDLTSEENGYHRCKRCKEGNAWAFTGTGTSRRTVQGRCVTEHAQNGALWPSSWSLGARIAVGVLILIASGITLRATTPARGKQLDDVSFSLDK